MSDDLKLVDQIKTLYLDRNKLYPKSKVKKIKHTKYKYIEGNELKFLKQKINMTLSLVDKLNGWELTFLNSLIDRIDYAKDNKFFLTQKQIEPLIEILNYRFDYLSFNDQNIEMRKGLGFYFKE